VNKILNTRYDFGAGFGGDGIKLVRDIYNISVSQALERLDGVCFPSPARQLAQQARLKTQKSGLTITDISELRYFPLVEYLKSRAIPIEIARQHAVQIEFCNKNGKFQKAIGFCNDAGSFEIRNKLFKGFIGDTRTITSIQLEHRQDIYLFE